MKWLEVGCPYCPAVLTLPSSASARSVACPECGKTYLVPTEQLAPPAAAPTIEMLASQWIEEAAAKDDLSLSASGMAPASQLQPSAGAAPPGAPPPHEPLFNRPEPKVAWSKETSPAAMRDKTDRTMTPEIAVDSPLPPVEILAPPQLRRLKSSAALQTEKTLPAPNSPTSRVPDAGADYGLAEAQLRIRRNRMRALINLGVLVGGTLLLVVFTAVVMWLARRR